MFNFNQFKINVPVDCSFVFQDMKSSCYNKLLPNDASDLSTECWAIVLAYKFNSQINAGTILLFYETPYHVY